MQICQVSMLYVNLHLNSCVMNIMVLEAFEIQYQRQVLQVHDKCTTFDTVSYMETSQSTLTDDFYLQVMDQDSETTSQIRES